MQAVIAYRTRPQVAKRKSPGTTFGQRLREERERLKLRQEDFAELGGVKRVTQHLYELSERFPDVRYLEALIGHGVDVQYLILGRRLSPSAASVQVSGEVLDEIYRAVEEFARDAKGNPMPIETKLQLFRFLRAALEGASNVNCSRPEGETRPHDSCCVRGVTTPWDV
jgi:transcriptional regulator with XRE-family HTH domain